MSKSTVIENIDEYKVLKIVKEGSSANVYLVEKTGQQFALKLLKNMGTEGVFNFRRESSTLARISHPNLVKAFDTGVFEGTPYIVMEYLDGNSIETEIGTGEPIPVDTSIEVVKSVTFALAELHKNNLLHRDIKPANIILLRSGQVRLIDLGLVGDIEEIKSEVSLVGSPMFCSPEQSRVLKREVDFRSDLYSVGATLFTMLAGRAPFIGTLSEILRLNASTAAPDVRQFNSAVNNVLSMIIAKLLSKDPDDRYQSASGLLSDLNELTELEQNFILNNKIILGKKDNVARMRGLSFVERPEEMGTLLRISKKDQSRDSQLVVVQGASGSGKSRLCGEFVIQFEGQKNLILRAKCQLVDRGLPLQPFRAAIEFLLNNLNSLPPTERNLQKEKIIAAGEGLESSLILLSKGLVEIFPNAQIMKSKISSSESDGEIFSNNICLFFERLAVRFDSLIFYIDDLQWLDMASAQIINKIHQLKSNILLLFTARDDNQSKQYVVELEDKAKLISDHIISLQPLSKKQLSSLVNKFLGSKNINEEIIDNIFQLVAGNPFIAIEYLRAATDQGIIYVDENTWKFNKQDLEKIGLSASVYELILKRVDNSSKETRDILQTAALVGNTFDSVDISAVTGISLEQIETIFIDCDRLGLVEKLYSKKWKFVHDKIAESLIQDIELTQINFKFEMLADYYFIKQQKSPEEIFLTARFFSSTNRDHRDEDNIQSQVAAGNLAFESFSYAEAYKYYQLAYELAVKSVDMHKIKISIAPQLAVCATMIYEERIAKESIDYYVDNSPTTERIKAISLKTWVLANLSDYVGACENFKVASELERNPYPVYLQWQLVQILCIVVSTLILEVIPINFVKKFLSKTKYQVDIDISNMYRTIQTCFELRLSSIDFALVSLKLLQKSYGSEAIRDKALGYSSVGYLYGMIGIKSLSQFYFEKAQQACEEINEPSVTAYFEFRKLLGLFYCGLNNDYQRALQKQRDFLEKYLPPLEFGRLITTLTGFRGTSGYHAEAIDHLTRNVEGYNKKSIRLTKTQHTLQLANLQMQLFLVGRPKEAQQVKSIQLKLSNEMRHNISSFRNAMTADLSIQRHTEELELNVDDTIRAYNLGGKAIGDPNRNYFRLNTAFIQLIKLENAQSEEEIFSLKRQLNHSMRAANLSLFCPLFRSNYYLIRGIYSRLIRDYDSAEYYFQIAEKLAVVSDHLIVLFDIQRNRALIHLAQNNFALARMDLSWAQNIAKENGWESRKRLLSKQFGHLLFINDSSSNSQTIASSRHSASETVQQGNSTVQRSVVGGSNANSGLKLEEIRLVDAILNVSNAFAISVNYKEQACAVLTEIIKLFAAERGFLFEFKNDQPTLQPLSAKNSEGIELYGTRNFSKTVVQKVIAERQPVVIVSTEEAHALGSESAVLHNLRSIIAAPLFLKDKLLGVIYLDSSLTRGLFTDGDIALLSTLANQISVAFELSRMNQVEEEKQKLKLDLDIQSAISAESKKVKILVDSMQQALFSVNSDGLIVEPISKFTEQVLGSKAVGENFKDVLYKDLPANSEKMTALQSAMISVFGEQQLQWDLMEDNFPRKIEFQTQNTSKRILKIKPSPIWNDEDNLDKILFVVEDVTELDVLESQLKIQKKNSLMIEELLQNEPVEISDFLHSTATILNVWFENANALGLIEKANFLRDLHTLKGNARSYKLSQLSELVHQAEYNLISNQDTGSVYFEDVEFILQELNKIKQIILEYTGLCEKLNISSTRDSEPADLNDLALQGLLRTVSTLKEELSSSKLSELNVAVERLKFKPISSMSHRLQRMVGDISNQLGKKVKFNFIGDVLLEAVTLQPLGDCLVHILRNSIDHGIESTSERMQKSKPEMGEINLKCEEILNGISISITDDGRGIDSNAVAASAFKKGFITIEDLQEFTEEQKRDLIFLPQFSTKDEASDISGRGIGMDSVKSTLEQLGGVLELSTTLGKGTQFTIRLMSRKKSVAA